MKTLQEMIKYLTGINVEQNKINDYLECEMLDLRYDNLYGADLRRADLRCANLKSADLQCARITKSQLEQLTINWGGWIMEKTVKELLKYYRTKTPYIDDPEFGDLYNDILQSYENEIAEKDKDIVKLKKQQLFI